ncbi:MAG: formylglycine-generating enzyme family protein [Desulfobacterales bacterium]|nr:formylglycine-generating enzyme family protein [Desulfobacterales bacterium]
MKIRIYVTLVVIFLFVMLSAVISSALFIDGFDLGEEKKPEQKTEQKSTQSDKTYTEPVTGMEFVWVEGGCYQMGSNSGSSYQNEKPVHKVCVDGFWMAKYEVTQGQWKDIMGTNPSYFKNCGNDCPVEKVSWNDAKDFIRKLNSRNNVEFRLPTEAEWEYAARSGGKNEKYAGGNNVDNVAWYYSNSGSKTHQVGTKAPNGLGLYDMSGNVWEWCEDVYDKNAYSKHSSNNPLVTSGSNYRVNRGGSWDDGPRDVRAADRCRNTADCRYSHLGFRLCSSQVRQ